ncbi:MAG: hypothetical protein V2A78_03850 [bacterium]
MNTLNLRTRYRPLRIGWCVRDGNIDDFRKVLRLTHTLWGGRYNPVIPINDTKFAEQLVNLFRVDALYPASDDKALDDFIKRFSYLPWPVLHKELFVDGPFGKMTTLLDVTHPILHQKDDIHKLTHPYYEFHLLDWDNSDPLGDVLLATIGSYPTKEECGIDYIDMIAKHLARRKVPLDIKLPLPNNIYKICTPSALTAYDLAEDFIEPFDWNNKGLYVGDAQDFFDLVNFWNLRACNIYLLFYDPRHAERLNILKDAYLNELHRDSPVWRQQIDVFTKSDNIDISILGSNIRRTIASMNDWKLLKTKPPLMRFKEQSALGSIADEDGTLSVCFQLPEKPIFDEYHLQRQHLVVSVNPLIDIAKFSNSTAIFRPPFIPELNEYYGRECYFHWNAARAEVDGLGIIIDITQTDLTLRALENRSLIAKIFEVFGMKAEPSQPGLISARLIQQMGGLQGCRVFKITGVRELIEKYSPSKYFTRSGAKQIIGKLNFPEFENLYIEKRRDGKLKLEDVLKYLANKGVFRVGLNFQCPNCELKFWLHLDDIKTIAECEYCGNKFNATSQLRDQYWAYRRSGLFGRDDHQEGGIPVALTLQQLDATLEPELMLYTTGMNINPITAPVNTCETDLVLITQTHNGRVQLAIGECKTRGEKIAEKAEKDVENLKKVADAFPPERFESFIVFSKTHPFTENEIKRCQAAQVSGRHRVIILSDRELEPNFIYERTVLEFDIRESVISLKDLAKNTHDIYFEPKPRAPKSNKENEPHDANDRQ